MMPALQIKYRYFDGQYMRNGAYDISADVLRSTTTTYQVIQKLFVSSHATIIEVKKGQTTYAMKVLCHIDTQKELRFKFEKKLLKELDHPNILKSIDDGIIKHERVKYQSTILPFIITKLYDGNLEKEVKRSKRLPPATVGAMATQVCEGLSYLHHKGVIHRDFKPGNIFINQGSIVIGDLGIAKTTSDSGIDRISKNDLTQEGEFVGPVQWMSPELLEYYENKKKLVDHRSDIFQFGKVLWFMLTGTNPLGPLDPDLDPTKGKYYDICTKMIQQKPDKRYQSVGEVKKDLER